MGRMRGAWGRGRKGGGARDAGVKSGGGGGGRGGIFIFLIHRVGR